MAPMVTYTTPSCSSEGQQQEDVGEAPAAAAAAAAAPAREYAGGDTETSAASKKKKNKRKNKKRASNSHVPDVVIYPTISKLGTFKVTQRPVSGRCVVASRDLEAGELVIHEPPFAKVVRRDCAGRQCASCCRQVTEGGTVVADVPFAVYCSRACKAEEAALRSVEAGALGKLAGISAARDVDVDLLRMVLRLLIVRAKALGLGPPDSSSSQDQEQQEEGEGGAKQEGSFLLEQWGNLHALMHHREARDPQWIAVVREAAEDLMEVIPEWTRIDVEEAVRLACRVNVNAHGLRDDSGSNLVIGVGLFPLTAMINHSCRPNCTFVYFDGQLEVRTLERVSAGTELNVYYIDLLQSTTARRKELLATKHFLCKCSRCERPEAADEYLDGVCCVDCGPTSCLSSTPPPSPEDILAAQLAQLGEIETSPSPAAGRKNGNGKGKGNKSKGGGGGGGGNDRTTGTGDAGVSSTPSIAPPVTGVNGRGHGVEGGGGAVPGKSGSEDVMYCPACSRQYPARAIEESVARAKSSWDGTMTVLRAKNFPLARKSLEKWLQDYDAGWSSVQALTSQAPTTGHRGRHLYLRRLHHNPQPQSLSPLHEVKSGNFKDASTEKAGFVPRRGCVCRLWEVSAFVCCLATLGAILGLFPVFALVVKYLVLKKIIVVYCCSLSANRQLHCGHSVHEPADVAAATGVPRVSSASNLCAAVHTVLLSAASIPLLFPAVYWQASGLCWNRLDV
ncbi:unnamed protein product [Pylaiella littoralis]